MADEIIKLATGNRRETSMPRLSGYLTTLTYLFPALGRAVRPMLERKGQRTKARLKAQNKIGVNRPGEE